MSSERMDINASIYVAGHSGLVGSAIVRTLRRNGYENLILKTHDELDLLRQEDVAVFFQKNKPDYVFLAAAKVGGIGANMAAPAQFLYENLMIESNIIHSAYQNGVKKLLFLGSSCIYPRLAPQPMKEEYLLDGKVEPTNEGYALAKIVGMKLCELYNRQYGTDYISVMPCNVYGEGDCFDLDRAHVVAALIRRFHEAKTDGRSSVTIWGTGKARRELLYVDDLADACIFMMNQKSLCGFVNVGTGQDQSIAELVKVIQAVVGFRGEICYDTTKPDGMPQKLLNVEKINKLGWTAQTSLEVGIQRTYQDYLTRIAFNGRI